jgi:hypothetical protein
VEINGGRGRNAAKEKEKREKRRLDDIVKF